MADQKVEPGFEIEGRFYASPPSYRLSDPVLVRSITGLTWSEYVDGLGDDDDVSSATTPMDPVILVGLIAVAVWQKHTTWSRERVERYVGQLDMGAVRFIGPDEEEEPDPPALPGEAPATPSSDSAETPSDSAESGSESPPPSSGTPQSAIGSPESTPA